MRRARVLTGGARLTAGRRRRQDRPRPAGSRGAPQGGRRAFDAAVLRQRHPGHRDRRRARWTSCAPSAPSAATPDCRAHGRRALPPGQPGLQPGRDDLEGGRDRAAFGATKNGALGVEAIVLFDPAPAKGWRSAASAAAICFPRCACCRRRCGLSGRRSVAAQRAPGQCHGATPGGRHGRPARRGAGAAPMPTSCSAACPLPPSTACWRRASASTMTAGAGHRAPGHFIRHARTGRGSLSIGAARRRGA